MSNYTILSEMDSDRNVKVEFLLADGSKSVQTLHINYDESRTVEAYIMDYLIAYENGLVIQAAEQRASASFDEADLERGIDELFSIWGDGRSTHVHGFINSFLRLLRPGGGIKTSLTLWQKKEVCLIRKILCLLKDIPGFDLLKKHLKHNPGGDDAHLLASYAYHSTIGLKQIESKSEKPFDADFSFQKEGCEYFVQVKDLTINPEKKFIEQITVLSRIQQVLDEFGIRSNQVLNLEGIVPKSILNPGFDWHEFLRSKDLSQPVIVPNEDGVTPPFCIRLISGDKGSIGNGIYSLKYLPNRINEVAELVGSHNSKTKKYVCLFFVGHDVVNKISELSSQVFELWRSTHLDGVIFMECQRSPNSGYEFDILEQYKAEDTFSLNRIHFTGAY